MTTIEGLKASIHLFEPRHFIMPFLVHALVTFTGAKHTFVIALSHKLKLVLVIGLFFLMGGIINAILLRSPIWFIIIDLVLAYFPMAWLGGKLVSGIMKD